MANGGVNQHFKCQVLLCTHVLISFAYRISMKVFMLELDPSIAVSKNRMSFDGIETKSPIGFLSKVQFPSYI